MISSQAKGSQGTAVLLSDTDKRRETEAIEGYWKREGASFRCGNGGWRWFKEESGVWGRLGQNRMEM